MLLGGPTANRAALAALLRRPAGASPALPLFDAAVALGAARTCPTARRHRSGRADLLGVDGIILLAVRPDGYVGLRADHDHLAALERYERLIRGSAGYASLSTAGAVRVAERAGSDAMERGACQPDADDEREVHDRDVDGRREPEAVGEVGPGTTSREDADRESDDQRRAERA